MTAATLEQSAMQWISDEAHRQRELALPSNQPPKVLLSPVSWVLPKLLRIVYQNTDQPVEAMAPLIRTMLQEQAFATTGGDPCDCERLDASINASVALLVSALQRVRDKHPAPPLEGYDI